MPSLLSYLSNTYHYIKNGQSCVGLHPEKDFATHLVGAWYGDK